MSFKRSGDRKRVTCEPGREYGIEHQEDRKKICSIQFANNSGKVIFAAIKNNDQTADSIDQLARDFGKPLKSIIIQSWI